jgi:spermidine/putrescine transport system ATP-binding protein
VIAGSQVELTVRPEKMELSANAPHGTDCAVRGTVTEVVYLGTSTNYNVRTSSGADVVVFTQNATSADDLAVRGDSIWLSWEPRHSYAIGA